MELGSAEIAATQTVNALVEQGADMLYERYLDDKVVPFTVAFISAFFADTLETFFHRQDQGESSVWTSAPELQRPLIDSWARGSVPIKRKVKVAALEHSASQPDTRSVRSAVTRPTFKPQKSVQISTGPNGMSVVTEAPKPFTLDLPQEVPNPEEDRLRVEKEKELKRRQEEDQRQKKIKEEEEEMLRRVQKMATDLKNREFTYDYSGAIVLVNPPKAERMPAYSQMVDFTIPEPPAEPVQKVRRRPQTKDITMTAPKQKKTPASELEFVRNLGTVQPPLLDNIKLNQGVVISEQGRVKRFIPERGKKATMSRTEYQQLVEQTESREEFEEPGKKVQSQMSESMKKSSVTFSKKDLLNELMDEEDEEEEVMSRRGSEKMSKASKKSRKEEFSPVDKFNMELLKAKDWGVNPQSRGAQLPDRLPARPTSKDQQETHGVKPRKPRDRPFIDTKTRTRLPPPPLGHSMGHGLISPRQPAAVATEEPA